MSLRPGLLAVSTLVAPFGVGGCARRLSPGTVAPRGTPLRVVAMILLAGSMPFVGCRRAPVPAAGPRIAATELAALATPLTDAVGSLSAVAATGDSVLVAWTATTRTDEQPFKPSVTTYWCYLAGFRAGDRWSRTARVALGQEEGVKLLRAGDACYALGGRSRRLFRIGPDYALTLVNRLDPPTAMAWQRFDAALLPPDTVVVAVAGLVPADSGHVRHALFAGRWRVGGGMLSWGMIASEPTWPRDGISIGVRIEDGRPVIRALRSDSTDTLARRGTSDGSSRSSILTAYLLQPDGSWRAHDEPAADAGARAHHRPVTQELHVRGPDGRIATFRNAPEDHRFAWSNLPNWLVVFALREPPVESVRYRASLRFERAGAGGKAVSGPDVPVAGTVDKIAGAATDGGGVFVYEWTEGKPWIRGSRAGLRVVRYAWPR